MPFPDDFPEKCGQCVKSFRQIPNKQCKFCQELKFDESVLCDLNRLMQSSHYNHLSKLQRSVSTVGLILLENF